MVRQISFEGDLSYSAHTYADFNLEAFVLESNRFLSNDDEGQIVESLDNADYTTLDDFTFTQNLGKKDDRLQYNAFSFGVYNPPTTINYAGQAVLQRGVGVDRMVMNMVDFSPPTSPTIVNHLFERLKSNGNVVNPNLLPFRPVVEYEQFAVTKELSSIHVINGTLGEREAALAISDSKAITLYATKAPSAPSITYLLTAQKAKYIRQASITGLGEDVLYNTQTIGVSLIDAFDGTITGYMRRFSPYIFCMGTKTRWMKLFSVTINSDNAAPQITEIYSVESTTPSTAKSSAICYLNTDRYGSDRKALVYFDGLLRVFEISPNNTAGEDSNHTMPSMHVDRMWMLSDGDSLMVLGALNGGQGNAIVTPYSVLSLYRFSLSNIIENGDASYQIKGVVETFNGCNKNVVALPGNPRYYMMAGCSLDKIVRDSDGALVDTNTVVEGIADYGVNNMVSGISRNSTSDPNAVITVRIDNGNRTDFTSPQYRIGIIRKKI